MCSKFAGFFNIINKKVATVIVSNIILMKPNLEMSAIKRILDRYGHVLSHLLTRKSTKKVISFLWNADVSFHVFIVQNVYAAFAYQEMQITVIQLCSIKSVKA